MPAYTQHLFVCGNSRPEGHLRGSCAPAGGQELRDAFKRELKRVGFQNLARAKAAGCLDQCEHGPVVVIYPQGIWYGGVTLADVPRIVQSTLLRGEVLNDLLISHTCLNDPTCPHRRSPLRNASLPQPAPNDEGQARPPGS
jgi:(2Fe-2S) ferredoxin